MTLQLWQVDAFTDRVFGGNPAAVVPLEAWLDDAVLQQIAAENNLSETAFTVPADDGYHLRWFTPTVEVDLCGHATLAAAHVLLDGDVIRFHSRSGLLEVLREDGRLVLDFPSLPVLGEVEDDAIVAALGLPPRRLFAIREVHYARYLLAEYASQDEVASLTGLPLTDTNVICTAPGDDADVDFVSRFFAPGSGVPEDPVTGSAHCTLTPFWAERLGKSSLRARQISARGGELWCEQRGDRVRIGGHAVTYLRGSIDVSNDYGSSRNRS